MGGKNSRFVATPLTYERYLHSYKGSWMSMMEKGNNPGYYPSKPKSIQNVYFAGQHLEAPVGCLWQQNRDVGQFNIYAGTLIQYFKAI